jgi:hypothetical protein
MPPALSNKKWAALHQINIQLIYQLPYYKIVTALSSTVVVSTLLVFTEKDLV